MDLSFLPLTLDAVDSAQAESLCIFVAADERPLTGLAGLADWRLAGRLSRLLRSGLLSGRSGEAILTPPGARLAFQKLFLFGVGPLQQSEDELLAQIRGCLRKLGEAGTQDVAVELPQRLSAEAGARLVTEELTGPGRAVVFVADPQRLAASVGSAGPERRVVKVGATPKAAPFAFAPAEGTQAKPPSDPPSKTSPPPPQKYVPPPAKPDHVFKKKKR